MFEFILQNLGLLSFIVTTIGLLVTVVAHREKLCSFVSFNYKRISNCLVQFFVVRWFNFYIWDRIWFLIKGYRLDFTIKMPCSFSLWRDIHVFQIPHEWCVIKHIQTYNRTCDVVKIYKKHQKITFESEDISKYRRMRARLGLYENYDDRLLKSILAYTFDIKSENLTSKNKLEMDLMFNKVVLGGSCFIDDGKVVKL
jgi:hypothetical protein